MRFIAPAVTLVATVAALLLGGCAVPIVSASAETLRERLRPLVADAAERRRLGAASRAYVELVHDQERITDRLLDVYARL